MTTEVRTSRLRRNALRRSFGRFLRFSGALALLTSIGCSLQALDMNGPQSVFLPVGTVAQRQGEVLWLSLWIVTGIFVIVGAALLFSVVRFRAKRGEEFAIPPQSHGKPIIEVGLIAISIVLLAVISVPNIRTLFFMEELPTDRGDAVKLTVIGHQWWWEFKFPDLGITTANELHLPVGKTIDITLESADVIHSFWIPKLAGKLDVIPGQKNRMWIRSDETGLFSGQCVELCGASHANMRFVTRIESEADFAAWAEREKSDARPETDATNGAEVAAGWDAFQRNGCIACHTVSGTFAMGLVGPNLSHFGSRTLFGAGIYENTAENLRAWISDPQKAKPGSLMILGAKPSDPDIFALIAYLQSLK